MRQRALDKELYDRILCLGEVFLRLEPKAFETTRWQLFTRLSPTS